MKKKVFLSVLCMTLVAMVGCKQKKSVSSECEERKVTSHIAPETSDPISIEQSKLCGTLKLWGGAYPKSLNMWLDYNSFSGDVMGLFFESLVELHSTENKPVGILAESWTKAEDGKSFTFKIRKEAKWSDGKSITARDFQFYYDVMMDEKNQTPIFRVGLKRFERPEIIDEQTLKITAKEFHWKNFWEAGGLIAFPAHAWEGKDFNQINWEFPVVSGPYELSELKKERSLTLKRRTDWWGDALTYNKGKYNFSKLRYRFMQDRTKALEALKKGTFDIYPIYTSSIWAKQTDFKQVQQNHIVKQKVYNKEPLGYQGMAMNLRLEKFKDLRVRKALELLLNRGHMNEKLMYNAYFLLNSYYPDLYPNNINPNKEVVKYNADEARKLLKEAGYVVNANGKLEKDGKVLSVEFITAMEDLRHLTIYLEDLKAVGIDESIKKLTWSAIRKQLDEHNFEMYWIAWGASRFRDPEAAWSSKEAMKKASNNIPGFQNAQVDLYIDSLKTISNLDERDRMIKAMDEILFEEKPYVLLWQKEYHRLLYWNRFQTPNSVLSKFGDPSSAVVYWALDEQKAEALKNAKSSSESLPKPIFEVKY